MSTKHAKTDTPSDADLKGNPGIGTSKGMTGRDPEDLEADSTFEGGIDPNHRPRKNA